MNGGVAISKPSSEDNAVADVLASAHKAFAEARAFWGSESADKPGNIIFYFGQILAPKISFAELTPSISGKTLTDAFNPLEYESIDRQMNVIKESRTIFETAAAQ
jgi:hypothetical protein